MNATGDKMIHGYLINPKDKTIHRVSIPDTDENHLASMYALLDCGCVDVVRLADNVDCWVDDEGLLKPEQHYFAINSGDEVQPFWQSLCGKALIFSALGGATVSATIRAATLLRRVRFFDPTAGSLDAVRASVTAPAGIEGVVVHQ
jgi:hypothetical protein